MDEKLKLTNDLKKKLDHLFFVNERPALHLSYKFDDIRNKIDIDAEQILQLMAKSKQPTAKSIETRTNEARTSFIKILKDMESRLQANLPPKSSAEEYLALEKRVEEFTSSGSFDDIYELEDRYLELALAILEQTNKLEKQIFAGETIVYLSSKSSRNIGPLVRLAGHYLVTEELSVLQWVFSHSMINFLIYL